VSQRLTAHHGGKATSAIQENLTEKQSFSANRRAKPD